MFNRSSFITAWGALLGLALTTATLSAVTTATDYVTFSGSVALPGVTLGAGTYIFEVADPMSTGDLVLVRNKATYRACFLGFTRRVDRPAGLPSDRSVVLGEAPRGLAPPVLAWYPLGDNVGHEFLHKRSAR